MSYPRNPHLTSNYQPFNGCGGELMSLNNTTNHGAKCQCANCRNYRVIARNRAANTESQWPSTTEPINPGMNQALRPTCQNGDHLCSSDGTCVDCGWSEEESPSIGRYEAIGDSASLADRFRAHLDAMPDGDSTPADYPKYGDRRTGSPDRREIRDGAIIAWQGNYIRALACVLVVVSFALIAMSLEFQQSERMLSSARHTIAAKQAELDNTYRQYNLLAGRVAK